MNALARLLAVFAACVCAPVQAQPSEGLAGVYVANVRETATALELAEDGRFAWFFSMGALDMRGEGRWTRTAEGDLLLDSDPPVVPPAFDLVRSARDRREGVTVRLVRESASAAPYLDVEAEYADGERIHGRFDGTECRFPSDPSRPLVAVRLGSAVFGFLSDPFPVSAAANLLSFRFVANDLGLADFRQQRVEVEPDALSLAWRGMALRYERVDPDRPVGSVDAVTDPGPAQGLVDVGLGEPFEQTMARSTYDFRLGEAEGPVLGGDGVVELRLRSGGRLYEAGAVGGADYLPWMIDRRIGERIVTSVRFSHQDRLLDLQDALARARALQAWLQEGGFVPGGPDFDPAPAPFMVTGPFGAGEQAQDWETAARLLADEEEGVHGMELYAMRAGDWIAAISLDNIRRMSTDPEGRAYIRTQPGLEWRLNVTLFMEPGIVDAADFPSARP